MNDAFLVGRLEGFRDLARRVERRLDRQRPRRELLGQCLSFDQLQDEEADAAGLLEAVDRGDVRVVERGEGARFPFEPPEVFRIPRQRI